MNAHQLESYAYNHHNPKAKDKNGKLNKALLDAIAIAAHETKRLIDRGFSPYRITVQGVTPTIWVRYTGHCKRLQGVTKIISNLPGQGRVIVMACRIRGAQIQWSIQGDHDGY